MEGLNVYMNYEFNPLHHVGVVAKASEYGGRDGGTRRRRQYPLGPNGQKG